MRLTAPLALFSAALLAAIGCSDSSSPNAPPSDVVLRTDATEYPLDTIGGPTAHAVFFANRGTAPVHLRFCNNYGQAAAMLKLLKQDGASWVLMIHYFDCITPDDGYDRAVAPGQEIQVAREITPREAGVFEYVVVYSRDDGVTEIATSAPYTVQ